MSLRSIDADVVRGRKPLPAWQFRELDADAHTDHPSPVERCLAMINGKLLGRSFLADCSYSLVTLGSFDEDVVEQALTILRDSGGWSVARIESHEGDCYTLTLHP